MSIQDHIARRDNPHGLTKAQVGLSNVFNFRLATREEVIAMERNDLYVDFNNSQWVSEAFRNYMFTLGIIDENGNYTTTPTDTLGSVYYYQDMQQVLRLSGTHPEANSVKVELYIDNSLTKTYDDVPVISTDWEINDNTISVGQSQTSYVIVYYKNSTGGIDSRAVEQLVIQNVQATFIIDAQTKLATLTGVATGFDSLNITIKDNTGATVNTFNAIDVSETTNWSVDFGDTEYEAPSYTAEIDYMLGSDVSFNGLYYSQLGNDEPGTKILTDPETGAEYVDFRRFPDLTDEGLYYIDEGAQ